jgi:esterase/lipase
MFKILGFLLSLMVSTCASAQNSITKEVTLHNNDITLPGTLSYPSTKEKLPLVIFIHGSGPVDRNGNQIPMGYNAAYIQQLADSLSTHNIAFYRYDKRTSNTENLKKAIEKGMNFTDFVADAKLAFQHFKNDSRFKSIYVIGHSQGSLIGMLLAQEVALDGYISLAGPSEPISVTILKQLEKQPQIHDKAKEHFNELKTTDTIQQVHPFLLSLFAPSQQKFIKEWDAFNPSEEIVKVTCKTLILQGDSDLQVTVEDANALHHAKPNALLAIIPNMNHVLKTVDSSTNMASYKTPNFPLSEGLLTEIINFIQ